MKELHFLSANERRPFFESAAYETEMSFEIIEKDYWVVWILERLFSLADLKSHITFKGGTSLSKVYGIIDRFSEDIDVSIERDFLGFDKKNDPETLSSRSKQKALLDNISQSCSQYIQKKRLRLTASDLEKILKRYAMNLATTLFSLLKPGKPNGKSNFVFSRKFPKSQW